MKTKRFLLFGGEYYYPLGGWGDFIQDFATADEAKEYAKSLGGNWLHIIDTVERRRLNGLVADWNGVVTWNKEWEGDGTIP